MDAITEFLGALTVTQRAILGVAAVLVAFAVLVAATSLVLSFRRALLLWLAVVAAVVAVTVLIPVDTTGLGATPRPEASYAAALARFEAENAKDPIPLNPLCEPKILGHGERTAKVVVLFHGVSSCPRAFVDFAPLLYDRGYNVLVARMPYNGHADRATDSLRNLTAEGLAAWGDASVDIAAGLGEEIVVLGISAGGTAAAWAAQNRPEVRRGVLVAPFFGLGNFGPRVNLALMRAMLLLPHLSIWKDPLLRDRFEGMPHAYQRQSTRATGEIMRLGLATYREATEGRPAAPEAAIVTNAADTAVANVVTGYLARRWQEGGMQVFEYEFPAEHGLGHELIDPLEPGADPALTYPVILQAIEDPSQLPGAHPPS
jgi:carboxylesterase